MYGHEAPPEKAGSFWNYREVHASRDGGPEVILTAATVPKPCAFIRVGDYHRTLAGDMRLFDDGDDPRNCIYVLLLTSRYRGLTLDDRRENSHLPGSAYLAWPSPDLLHYTHAVNLIERYPEIVKAYLPETWTNVVVMRYLAQARRMAF